MGDGVDAVFAGGGGGISSNFYHLALAVGASVPRVFLPISEYAKIYANLHNSHHSCSVSLSTQSYWIDLWR